MREVYYLFVLREQKAFADIDCEKGLLDRDAELRRDDVSDFMSK